MKRQEILAVFVLVIAVLFAYSPVKQAMAQKTPPKTKPVIHKPEPEHLVPLPRGIQKILARDFIVHARLRACKGTIVPPPAVAEKSVETFGGFACSKVHLITLTVNGDAIDASPNKLTGIKNGDCVEWQTLTSEATLEAIDFIDTAQEATAKGKASSHHGSAPVGDDVCTAGGKYCVAYIGLPEGHYWYEARVKHGSHTKKTDPELEVGCGTGCGSPDDLPH